MSFDINENTNHDEGGLDDTDDEGEVAGKVKVLFCFNIYIFLISFAILTMCFNFTMKCYQVCLMYVSTGMAEPGGLGGG